MSRQIDIVELTGVDEADLRTWAEVTAGSSRHELGANATAWAAEELLVVARHHDRQRRGRFFAARMDGEIVGTGWLCLPLLDNLTSAEIDVNVRPDLRRRGIGTQLLEHLERLASAAGRTLFNAEAMWPYDGPPEGEGTPGCEFARRHGYRFGLGDVQRMLPLPIPDQLLDEIAAETADHHTAYELRTFSGTVPDELVESWLGVAATLNLEAPLGAMEREAESLDVEAHRTAEQIEVAQGRTAWHTVALDAAGDVVAYTQLMLPEHDRSFAYQWGTLVRRDHRGHRLGTAIKVANLRAFQAASEVRGRRLVTWNAEVNDHMIGINVRLGFVPTSRLAELQKNLDAPG
ncbi:hypothetical protein ASE01_06830 [Nocardioides sp. Root190]|uniref:GNAT family N-acetyltransferase n=1 Tax=Nocardioides sp. Root190 TaxID=1736488 RepID=UPI0006F59219|nr:GNAT family N-acetyltransferase [Nocardioides sp. Root190]KRB77890.1 hypothetical protein ASE01_06830 [Nocardioides sp. Root190]